MAHVIWFHDIGIGDIALVGGKNASLGEMVQTLVPKGIRIPSGFATTTGAYRTFLAANGLEQPIQAALDRFRQGGIALSDAGAAIRSLILKATFSDEMKADVGGAYDQLAAELGIANPAVAVRSSATAEDLGDASFAGQQETFLNVRGKPALLNACRRCYASLFTDRAISYRELKSLGKSDVALAVGVQHMVRADLAGSGVMFTLDTETGFPRVVVISATWGLGETVVQGLVEPDRYLVFKPLLKHSDLSPIIEKTLGAKGQKMVYSRSAGGGTRLVATPLAQRAAHVLEDREILQLARWSMLIEDHYARPMDIEWAKDAETGQLFILQARPETVQSTRDASSFDVYRLTGKARPLLIGAAVGDTIAAGKACIIRNSKDIERFSDKAILVTETTNPDWVPIMKRAAGVVTDHGGATSHAAIVSRELGVPAVIGTGKGTDVLRDGQDITISCAEGDKGAVYDGSLDFVREQVEVGAIPQTKVAVMINMANPAAAFRWWRLPVKGIGLARMEFIISALIRLHPMAAAHPERLGAAEAKRVFSLSAGYADAADFFVSTLARGIAKLATPFHPYPAIVRFSDFKTNEYADLTGGEAFESAEENPMLGFRGACRYYDPRYRDGFALECQALKRVREEIGFTNVIAMIPFCRTLGEADEVLAVMAQNGLRRGDLDLQVYMMCEIPSNVILASEFARRFDGFSIGSNDLTQLVLGVDRDAAALAKLFDERDEAVKQMVKTAIREAHAAGIKIGICGQAPSNYPEFAAFLVSEEIDSISLNPDSFVRTMDHIAQQEASRRSTAMPDRKPA